MFPEEAALRDPNKMLSIMVTTVMLLASGKTDIPHELLIWTEHYLQGVLVLVENQIKNSITIGFFVGDFSGGNAKC